APRNAAYNDIDMANWKAYDDIDTDSLWLMASRERTGGHANDYHGNCIPQILTQMLKRYTKSGDTMIDFFLGSGTSAIEAHRLGRQCIGVEIQPRMADYVQEKIDALGAQKTTRIITGDSGDHEWTGGKLRQALKSFGVEKCHFAFLHPPYADIIQFSSLE